MKETKLSASENRLVKALRKDGWFNLFTNQNMPGKDKMTGAGVKPTFLTRASVEAMYQSCDISAKVIERLPNDMLRQGYKIKIKDDNEDRGKTICDQMKVFDVNAKMKEAMVLARMLGGAAMIFGLQDGKTLDQPVDFGSIEKITFVTVLDRHQLSSGTEINADLASPNFGLPEYYYLNSAISIGTSSSSASEKSGLKIHHSRMVRFYGATVPKNLRAKTQYWGDSILSRLVQNINNFTAAYSALPNLVVDFNKMILKLKRLESMLAQGKDDLVIKRLKLLSLMTSYVNATVLQDGDDMQNRSINLTGLADIVKLIGNRLVAATEMTHDLLLGESPSGLGATGESENRNWYDHVKNEQTTELTPKLEDVTKFFMAAKNSPTKGVILPFDIEYNPLWQLDDKERADVGLKSAQSDQIYIQEGVFTAQEIRDSRDTFGRYTMDTMIDPDTDPALINPQDQGGDGEGGLPQKQSRETNSKDTVPPEYNSNPDDASHGQGSEVY